MFIFVWFWEDLVKIQYR